MLTVCLEYPVRPPNRSGRASIEIGAHGAQGNRFLREPSGFFLFLHKAEDVPDQETGMGRRNRAHHPQIDCKSGFECGQSQSVGLWMTERFPFGIAADAIPVFVVR